jgi:tetratricopeptide (TPR) repeat protein
LKKYALSLVIILVLVFWGCSSSKEAIDNKEVKQEIKKNSNQDEAKQKVIQGSLYEAKGDFANAILEYQEALQLDENAGIYFLLAKDYNELSKYPMAIQNAKKAIELDSTNNDYKEILAGVFINTMQIDSAIRVYENVIKSDSSNLQALFSLATLYKKSKPITSLSLYKKLVEELGPRWDILVNMMEIYSKLDKSSEELKTMEELIGLDPSNTKLKELLAEYYFKSGQIDKAVNIYQDILETDPGNDLVRLQLADLLSRNNQIDKSIEIYKGLQKNNSNNPEYQSALGFLYVRKRDWTEAEKVFSKIISNDTLKVEYKLDICSFLYFQGDSDQVALSFSKKMNKLICNKHPKDSRAYLYLSAIYAKEDSSELVDNYFDKFIKHEKENPVTRNFSFFGTEVGRVYLAKDQFEKGAKYLEKTKELFPNDYFLLFYLGISYSRMNMNDQSLTCLEASLDLNPTRELAVEIISQLGLTYDGMKNFAKSDSLYELGLKLDPDNHLLLNNYSYSLSERGLQLERSEKMSKKALEKDPNNSSYLDTYGWILYRMEKYKEAETYIKKAVDLRDTVGGNGSVLNEHLGDVYFKLGNKETALFYWNQALKMNPDNNDVKEKIKRGGL